MESPNPLAVSEMAAFDALPPRMKEYLRENGGYVRCPDVLRFLSVMTEDAIIGMIEAAKVKFFRENPICR